MRFRREPARHRIEQADRHRHGCDQESAAAPAIATQQNDAGKTEQRRQGAQPESRAQHDGGECQQGERRGRQPEISTDTAH